MNICFGLKAMRSYEIKLKSKGKEAVISFILYFLGVKESHFVYRLVKVFFRYIDVEKV